jgi:hypothetical protein
VTWGLEEVEFFFGGFEGLVADAAFLGGGVDLFEFSVPLGLVGAVAVTFDGTVTEPGDGVEQTGIFIWVVLECFSHGDRVEVDEELAEVSGGDLEGGLVDLGTVFLGKEVGGELSSPTIFIDAVLFAEPILVSADEPVAEVFGEEDEAGGTEVLNDGGVTFAVLHHDVDFVADLFGELSDFAFSAGGDIGFADRGIGRRIGGAGFGGGRDGGFRERYGIKWRIHIFCVVRGAWFIAYCVLRIGVIGDSLPRLLQFGSGALV